MAKKQKLEVANCDLKKIDGINIESLIRIIRGQQVMLDSDLAMLYGVETKALNQAVKRNVNRFPDDFMFQLTQEEAVASRSQIATLNDGQNSSRSQNVTLNEKDANLKSQFVTSKTKRGQNIKYLPYAFTRNGIAMLSSVLKSETAVGVNIRIMRAFTMIPQLVNYNAQLVQRIFNIEQHQQETDEKIDIIIEKIEEISPKPLPEQVFPTGCVWDAWTYISDLVRSARQRIVLIDNFVDERTLLLLDKRAVGVECTVHTRFSKQSELDFEKHNEQNAEIKRIQLPLHIHDRYLIVDNEVWLLGASVKDMGRGLCTVIKVDFTPEMMLSLLK
jgi:hypothetical protein